MDDLSPKAIDQRDRPLLVVSFKGTSDEIERPRIIRRWSAGTETTP
jgi:hypothetical protein